MHINLHLLTRRGFHSPDPAKTYPETALPDSINGTLVGPLLAYSPIRIRTAPNQIIETPPLLRLGAGWCVTTHGSYLIHLQPEACHSRESFGESGPTWDDREKPSLFDALRTTAIPAFGLLLKESLGLDEFFTPSLLASLGRHADTVATAAPCPASQVVEALKQSMSVAQLYPLANLSTPESLSSLLALRRQIPLGTPNQTGPQHHHKVVSFDYIILVRGTEVIYAEPKEFPLSEAEFTRCLEWLDKHRSEALNTEDAL